MKAPSVSVIILNFNGVNYLERCLSSVLATKYTNFEAILVDNASTDCSLDLVQKSFGSDKRLRIIRNSENLGFSAGNNVGFRHATGKYIIFLNNDTVVDPCWLTYLIDAMERDKTIGLAQSMLLEIDGKEIQVAGWLSTDYFMCFHAIGNAKPSNTKFPLTFESSFVSGAAMIIGRELVTEIGLFDPCIPFYYDDTLLSFKTWLAGKRVVTISESKVYHIWQATTGCKKWETTSFMLFHFLRAKICLTFDVYYKFSELTKALFILANSLLRDSIYYIISKQLAFAFSHVRAVFWAFRNLRYIWSNRLRYWGSAKIAPEMLIAKFIRRRLPTAVHLLPAKLRRDYYAREFKKCENMLRQVSTTA